MKKKIFGTFESLYIDKLININFFIKFEMMQ